MSNPVSKSHMCFLLCFYVHQEMTLSYSFSFWQKFTILNQDSNGLLHCCGAQNRELIYTYAIYILAGEK